LNLEGKETMSPVRFTTPARTALTALTIAAIASACGPAEEDTTPAAELDPVHAEPADIPFPNAPSPDVRQAAAEAALEVQQGEATFYADMFEGRRTASGRTFRQAEMVAAHRAFPFGTRLQVTNLRNDRQVEVRVVDRGPFGSSGRLPPVIDLSRTAAERLGFIDAGRTPVRVEVLEWGA